VSTPSTLLALAGRAPVPPRLADATLVLIDYQNEYLVGPIALPEARSAVERAAELLARARAAGSRIIHIAHKGGGGGPFDRALPRGAIIDAVSPVVGETVIEKPRPNAFSGTDLAATIGAPERPLIIAGFMTHMCVSSTVRAALDLGYATTVASDACATRDLPGVQGGVVGASDLHEAELAALADRFAGVFPVAALI
jgi:nicotinamidase-related amidase